MTPFRTILFAADFSENSKEAFRAACSLAVLDQTGLVVLHVVEPDAASAAPPGRRQEKAPTGDKLDVAAAERLSQKLRDEFVPNHPIKVTYRVQEGEIAAVILQTASANSADLIALGTHGRTGLRRMLAGSVATSVLRGAKCPVLALRSGAGTRGGEQTHVILHPTDFSECSEAALGVAGTLARNLGARLAILHVAPLPVVMGGSMAAEVDPRYHREALDRARQRVEGPDLKYPVETQLLQGLEPDGILQVATELGCDLIVMGTHGRTGMGRLMMGSVAEFVLARADCPVIVVKAPGPLATPAAGEPAEHKTITVI
jgi:nucleotide-binding universal stress UspA family protein